MYNNPPSRTSSAQQADQQRPDDCAFLDAVSVCSSQLLADVYFERSTNDFSNDAVARSTAAKLKLESFYKVAVDAAIERNARHVNTPLPSLIPELTKAHIVALNSKRNSCNSTLQRQRSVKSVNILNPNHNSSAFGGPKSSCPTSAPSRSLGRVPLVRLAFENPRPSVRV